MVQELLQEFYRNTKKRPEKIIVYRDGVSEGQFDAVVREELPQVRQTLPPALLQPPQHVFASVLRCTREANGSLHLHKLLHHVHGDCFVVRICCVTHSPTAC